MSLRRTAVAITLSAAAILLAAAPAHAEYVCWMSDGIRYCYDPNDGKLPVEPPPAPVEEPTYSPAPPAPSVEQPWVQPVPAQPVPVAPAPVQPAPAPANNSPVHPVPVPAYTPPQSNGYYAPAVEAPVAAADVQVEQAPEVSAVPTDVAPIEEAPPATPTAEASASATSTATASPSAPVTLEASATSGQASSTGSSLALPLVSVGTVMLIACAAVLFVVRQRRKFSGAKVAQQTSD